jgi:hypothetical protein
MNEHTKGPWTVNGFGGDFEVIARLVPSGVAISAKSPCASEDAIATARLIAAAPQLLDALIGGQAALLAAQNDQETLEFWAHRGEELADCKARLIARARESFAAALALVQS